VGKRWWLRLLPLRKRNFFASIVTTSRERMGQPLKDKISKIRAFMVRS
jgi:hypothetical protein